MNSIYQFLIDILPTSAEKVQAWTGVLGFGAAIYAYRSWKKEKKYDLNIEALSKIPLLESLIWNYIFEFQNSLEKLRDINNTGSVKSFDIFNTAREFLDINDKLENSLLEIGFYSTIILIENEELHDSKFKRAHKFYLEVNTIIDNLESKISPIIVEHLDKKPIITQENLEIFLSDFKNFSIVDINTSIESFKKAIENFKTPKPTV